MKKTLKIMMVLVVTLSMLISMTACGGTPGTGSGSTVSTNSQASTSTATSAQKELVTIRITETNNIFGTDTSDEVSKAIEKKLNIKLEYSSNDADKFKLLIAGNDLGDVVICGDSKQLIDGNQVLAMDDLLKTNGPDLLKNCADKIAFSKKYISEGQNKLYWLPAHGLQNVQDMQTKQYFEYQLGNFIRWDYYKELGYPEVKNWDDFLKVLLDIQKKHPTTADGKKVYGLQLWTDWGNFEFLTNQALGYDNQNIGSSMNYMDHTGKLSTIATADDSFLWKSIKNYWNAKQMGLLDPDSFTQKKENGVQKLINGQVLAITNGWDNGIINPALAQKFGPEVGLGMLPTVMPVAFADAFSTCGWKGFATGIAASSKYPDRAMDLINYLSSYEGVRLVKSGAKDIHWTMVNGKPEVKADVLQQSSTDPDFRKKTGISRETLDHLIGLDGTTVDPADGTALDLFSIPKALELKNSPFNKSYSTYFGVTFPGAAVDKAIKDGKVIKGLYNTIVVDLLPSIPDDMKRIESQIKDYLTKLIPKMILTPKTEAEFNAMQKIAQDDMKKMGAETLYKYVADKYTAAQTELSSLGK